MAQQGIIMKRNSTNSPILIPIAVSTHPLSTLALQEEYIIVKAYFASFVCLSIYHLNYSSTNTSRDCLLFSIFYLLSSLLLLGFFFFSSSSSAAKNKMLLLYSTTTTFNYLRDSIETRTRLAQKYPGLHQRLDLRGLHRMR